MKMTIDMGILVKNEAFALHNSVSETELRKIFGEALLSAMRKLLVFREGNESIAIDGAFDCAVVDAVTARNAV